MSFKFTRFVGAFLALAGLAAWVPSQAELPAELLGLHGRVVYLDFWASWCTPCRQSFPWMESLHDAYQAEGLSVVAVNVDSVHSDAERFLQSYHTGFDIRFDPKGALAERFKVEGMPTSVLIDRHGVVRYTHIGFRPLDQQTYEQQLRQLLAEK